MQGDILKRPETGKKSLKAYEITNFLFFLTVIVAFGVVVSFVFHFYGTRNQESAGGSNAGVISEALNAGSDVGIFYLDTKISESTLRYRNQGEIPATDDGFLRDLFSIPGVQEVTVDQKMIVMRKNPSARWENIAPSVRRIVKNHLHLHY